MCVVEENSLVFKFSDPFSLCVSIFFITLMHKKTLKRSVSKAIWQFAWLPCGYTYGNKEPIKTCDSLNNKDPFSHVSRNI